MGVQSLINNHVYVPEPSKTFGHRGWGSIRGGQCSVHIATSPDSMSSTFVTQAPSQAHFLASIPHTLPWQV